MPGGLLMVAARGGRRRAPPEHGTDAMTTFMKCVSYAVAAAALCTLVVVGVQSVGLLSGS
jgi:hypothetical protein